MRQSEVSYGDVHWHTHFSDNRDRASVEEMVREAARFGLTIFGTGDHNHNLTAPAWEREKAETDTLRRTLAREDPRMVVLNSCEITFLCGHFLVFEPPHVDGTAREGYGYLYEPGAMIMINHPGLPTDQWSARIIPGASAVEVINGAVLRDAAARGVRVDGFTAPVDAPMLSVFGRYAACGLPVAAMGSSDAHRLRELGFGTTGYLLSGPPSAAAVLKAIRHRRTFAATDAGIELRWETSVGPGRTGEIRLEWAARFAAAPGRPDTADADETEIHSWLYRGLLLEKEAGARGEAVLAAGGLYWIVARAGTRFAVSSVIVAAAPAAAPSHPADPAAADDIRRAASLIMKDLAWMSPSASPRAGRGEAGPATVRTTESTKNELRDPFSFLCESARPAIRDAQGRDIPFEVLRHERVKRIIDKEAPPSDFDEFYVWLERNEIHECRFEALTYRLEGSVFCLDAALLPVLTDARPGAGDRYRAWIQPIRELLARAEKIRIRVGILPTITVCLGPGAWSLPLTVTDPATGLKSELRELAASPGQCAFPESWRRVIGPREQRFLCQFFTA